MENIKNNRWLTVITLLLITANIVILALLWMHKKGRGPDDRMPPPPAGQAFEFITHELKLDTAQQETYKKLREAHQADVRPLQDSLRSAKDAFFALLQQSNVSDTTLQAANKKIGDIEDQLNLTTFRHFQKLRAICTAEQQKKFDTIIQDVLRRLVPQRPQGPPPRPGREGDRPPGDRMPPPPNGGNEPPPPNGDRPPPPGQ